MDALASITINVFYLFQQTLFNKGFVVEGGRGSLKSKWKQTGEGRSQTNLYAQSVKNCLIFQIANRVPSNNLLGSCKKCH